MKVLSSRDTVSEDVLNSRKASRNGLLWPDTIEQAGAAAILQTLNGNAYNGLPLEEASLKI